MKKLSLIIFVLLCLIVLPSMAFAVELEQTYPELSAIKSITKTTSITGLIRYLSTWAIVIAVLAVVVNLIAAGMQYLTSAGRAGKMTEAKSRIFRSVLGLAILAASYLILVTINPQLAVLKIEYVPVESGLFLFTFEGYDKFTKDGGFARIDELIGQKQIYPIMGDIRNMSSPNVLGMLGVAKRENNLAPDSKAEKVDFINFPLYALGFWGLLEQDAKVIMYSEENFKGEHYEYIFKEKLDKQGGRKREYGTDEYGMQIMVFRSDSSHFEPINDDPNSFDADFFKTIKSVPSDPEVDFLVDYVNLLITQYHNEISIAQRKEVDRNIVRVQQMKSAEDYTRYDDMKSRYDPSALPDVIYPPLSLRVRRTGPGVYLYADEKHYNEEKRFTESHNDLSQIEIDFDKEAKEIKLINIKEVFDEDDQPIAAAGEQHDYLAILHEDPFFTGHLRLFFAQRWDETEQIPIMCPDGRPKIGGKDCDPENNYSGYDDFVDDKGVVKAGVTLEDYLENFKYHEDSMIIGNMGDADNPKALKDAPLKIAPESPLEETPYGKAEYVSSVSVFELNPDPSVCKEVKICTEKNFAADDGYCISYSYKGANTKKVPQTGIVKFPMPLYRPVNIPDKAWVVKSKKDTDGSIEELDDEEFAQKIKSLHMTGDCLVVLFENKIEDWPEDGPGPHSQAFPLSSKQDLSRYEIGRCGSRLRQVAKRWLSKPCAQSIVVYPIKREE